MDENKEKRVLRVKLDDNVKKVSITGKNGVEKVVMKQELSEDELDMATGGDGIIVDWQPMTCPAEVKESNKPVGNIEFAPPGLTPRGQCRYIGNGN